MFKHSISGWLVAIVFLGVLIGVVGGGLMGGVAGYYVALNRAPVLVPAESGQLAVSNSPSQPPAVTNLTVSEDSAVIDTVKKTEPGVVTVINTLQAQSGRGFRQFGPNSTPSEAEGSGVIIDTQGHIITNAHVVDGASQLDVIFSDGSKVSAKLVGADPVSDIAVLQVSGNIPAVVPMGDSNALQLGETVIAIGSPLGSYRGSVTVGVVSGLNRSVDGTGQESLIQTDAAINHGNSGGPLQIGRAHV
jgi:2-alkenal reductase